MENNNLVNNNPLDEEESLHLRKSEVSKLHFEKILIGIIGLLVVLLCIQLNQQKNYSNLVEHRAYVLSSGIDLMEDNLLFKYGLFPQDIGLNDLRDNWIDDPCYETSILYYQALKEVLAYLSSETVSEPTTVGYSV